MYFLRKLKPPEFNIESLIGILFGIVFVFLLVVLSVPVAFGFISFILLIYSILILIIFIRTGSIGHLILSLALFVDFIFTLHLTMGGLVNRSPWTRILAFFVIVLSILLIIVIVQRKLKWRSREIFELAAMPVKDISDGFTERPLAAGKADFTKSEMMAFANFMHSNLIAIPYIEQERIVFSITISLSRQLGINRDYHDGSWVAFYMNGEVSVTISEKDYMKYRDLFSFDQLCENLGSTFVDFLEIFKRNEGIQILEKLNTLRLNPWTE